VLIPVHRIPGRSNKAKGRASAVVVAHAIVDDDRADLAGFFWTLSGGYAVRRDGGTSFMHHCVIGRWPGLDVSHLNANKLAWRGKVRVNGRTYQTTRFATPEEARDALAVLRLSVRQFPEVRA
jgi:hypothetical protein